jgi:transcription elongation factor GreA
MRLRNITNCLNPGNYRRTQAREKSMMEKWVGHSSMTETNYLTAEGAERLKKELEQLKGPAREQLSARLRSAIEEGDLSENADYISAKEEQGFLEGRIQELEQLLKTAVIIDEEQAGTEEVSIGNYVTIQERGFSPTTYHVVGPKEADPGNGKISHLSPIGKALLGHKKGEEIDVEIPDGELHIKILKIK